MKTPGASTSCHDAETDQKPPAIFLMDPTASGRTSVALTLIKQLPLEITERRGQSYLYRIL